MAGLAKEGETVEVVGSMGDEAIADHESEHAPELDRCSVVASPHHVGGRHPVALDDDVLGLVGDPLEARQEPRKALAVGGPPVARVSQRARVDVGEILTDMRRDRFGVPLGEGGEVRLGDGVGVGTQLMTFLAVAYTPWS